MDIVSVFLCDAQQHVQGVPHLYTLTGGDKHQPLTNVSKV